MTALMAASAITTIAWVSTTLRAEVRFNFSGHYWDFSSAGLNKIVGVIIFGVMIINVPISIWKAKMIGPAPGRFAILLIIGAVLIAGLTPAVLNVLSRDGRVGREFFVIAFSFFVVLGFFFMVIIWINTTRERTTFMAKLVLTTLVTFLLLLQALTYFASRGQEIDFDALHLEQTERAVSGSRPESVLYVLRRTSNGKVSYVHERSDYHVAVPEHRRSDDYNVDLESTELLERIQQLPDAGFRKGLNSILAKAPQEFKGYAGAIRHALDEQNLEGAPLRAFILRRLDALNRMTQVASNQIAALPTEGFATSLATYLSRQEAGFTPFSTAIAAFVAKHPELPERTLRSDVLKLVAPCQPAMIRTYRESPSGGTHFIAYKRYHSRDKAIYEVGFAYRDYRLAMHQTARIQFAILVITLAILFLIFPLFFRGSLISPLNALIGGIGRVNEGDLTAKVPVRVEDEIGYLTSSFNRMVDSIREARTELEQKNLDLTRLDQIKDEFLANTSHELRTPLNGIIGIADSLVHGAAGELDERVKKNLGLIISSGRRLAALVNDILDFSKLKNHEIALSLKPVDLKQVSEVVLMVSQPLLTGKDLHFINNVPDNLPALYADENRLQQILHNLIGNAVKFTEKGQITLEAKVIDDSSLEFAVVDTGIGIPKEKLESIFQSFEQVDASTEREYGGTGLGLSITRQLVELHGGSIGVDSAPGAGSRFFVRLPRATEAASISVRAGGMRSLDMEQYSGHPEAVIDSPEQIHTSETNHRILIVDDEPVNRQVLHNFLSVQNYTVFEAAEGQTALEMIQAQKPNLILLDVMMPRMNGYQVCRKIREIHSMAELPVIMLTAKNLVSDLVEGMRAGANDYIPKPFSRDELFARMRTQLELSSLSDSFSRFVPRQFLRYLGKDSVTDIHLGDQVEREMTVLFSDIRSFTTLSESMTPEENFNFLNAIFRRVGPVIRTHGGFIDKFIGDAIMALFPRTASDALDAAIKMREMLRIYNVRRIAQGFLPVETGTGIHTGTLMLGTIGESERMDSTVISDAVNLTARLESLSKLYGAGILISERVIAQLEDPGKYRYRFLDQVKVKGKRDSVSVFEVFDGAQEEVIVRKMITRSDFERGLQSYHSQDFTRASVSFKEVLAVDPGDSAAELYLKRSAHYMVHGPPPEWESVAIMESK